MQLQKQAVMQARAGADIVAPSGEWSVDEEREIEINESEWEREREIKREREKVLERANLREWGGLLEREKELEMER